MNIDPIDLAHALAVLLYGGKHFQRRRARGLGMIDLGERRAPESHNCVADVLIERPARVENDIGKIPHVVIEKLGQSLRIDRLRERREVANVTKKNREILLL